MDLFVEELVTEIIDFQVTLSRVQIPQSPRKGKGGTRVEERCDSAKLEITLDEQLSLSL